MGFKSRADQISNTLPTTRYNCNLDVWALTQNCPDGYCSLVTPERQWRRQKKKHWRGENDVTFNDDILFVQMKMCCSFYGKFLLLNVRIASFESFVTLTIRVCNNAGVWEQSPQPRWPMRVRGGAPSPGDFHNFFQKLLILRHISVQISDK